MTSNTTKIKYIAVCGKIYEVEKLSFYNFTVSARETDATIEDIPAEEVFDISDFPEFRIKLRNWHGNVVDFKKFLENQKVRS